MLHYYLNLPKDRPLDFETNMGVSNGIMQTARRAFEPFQRYLQTVIRTMENKEAVQARWEKIKESNLAELRIIGGIYKIPRRTVIQARDNQKGLYRIVSDTSEPDFGEKLKYKAGAQKGEIEVTPEDFQKRLIALPMEVTKFDRVVWGFDDVELRPAWADFKQGESLTDGHGTAYKILSVKNDEVEIAGTPPEKVELSCNGISVKYTVKKTPEKDAPGVILREDTEAVIVYCESGKATQNAAERIDKVSSLIDWDALCFEGADAGKKLEYERNEGLTITLRNSGDYGKTVRANNIKFRIDRTGGKSKDAYWIRLIEMNDKAEKEDESFGLSPLRYFFDDDISIQDEKKNEYLIAEGRETENKIILKPKDRKTVKQEYCFPEGKILTVRVNTYPLKKQLEAVSSLMQMPVGEHAQLIRLFEDKKEVEKHHSWKEPLKTSVAEWHVITDEGRSGCAEQRRFVEQALSTQDFAILEGPPGSGKTTVILELICQLIKQGKRVLLCGSTHVAIDNILERLKEKHGGKSLLEQFTVLPVRIGDENRINEDIREFQIDNLVNNNDIEQKFLLDAANLVCGTTIGILQHPQFKTRNNFDYVDDKGKKIKNSWIEPVIPEFDYLIIDESSKTTFQEFLVPALYAKKWVLAGDVMQLSPFTDRAEIVSNIENIAVDGKPVDKSLQDACFYLQKLKMYLTGNNRFVLPVKMEVADHIFGELKEPKKRGFENKIVVIIVSQPLSTNNPNILVRTRNTVNILELAASDLIVIEERLLLSLWQELPETHAVLGNKTWCETEHAFRHNAYQRQRPFSLQEKGKEIKISGFEVAEHLNRYFSEKNWAEEIAWRIDRLHQLRKVDEKKIQNEWQHKLTRKEKYIQYIDDLMPLSFDKEKVLERIYEIKEMAFPSILESLVHGISINDTSIRERKTWVASTISEGFGKALDRRKTKLVYQHRMHPDISRFPRERYYTQKTGETALRDLEQPRHIRDLREWDYHPRYSSQSVWIDVKGETKQNRNQQEVDVMEKHLRGFIDYAREHAQPEGKTWSVACLTFYRGQERALREMLQRLSKRENGFSSFPIDAGGHKIDIKLHTVDKFQGHEADIVFLSMVQTYRDGFMDNPNRLNVAITRAKFQIVIIGDHDYFARKSRSGDLTELAKKTKVEEV